MIHLSRLKLHMAMIFEGRRIESELGKNEEALKNWKWLWIIVQAVSSSWTNQGTHAGLHFLTRKDSFLQNFSANKRCPCAQSPFQRRHPFQRLSAGQDFNGQSIFVTNGIRFWGVFLNTKLNRFDVENIFVIKGICFRGISWRVSIWRSFRSKKASSLGAIGFSQKWATPIIILITRKSIITILDLHFTFESTRHFFKWNHWNPRASILLNGSNPHDPNHMQFLLNSFALPTELD